MLTSGQSARLAQAALLVGCLIATTAACSASDQASSTSVTSSAITTTTAVAAGSSSADDASFVGDPRSPWCQSVPGVSAAGLGLSRLDMNTATPDDIKTKLEALLTQLDQAVPLAPVEIEFQVDRFADNIGELNDELAAAGYVFAAADQTRIGALNAELTDVGSIIDEYNTDVCTAG